MRTTGRGPALPAALLTPGETIREPRVAINTVFHGSDCPTAIRLPVLQEQPPL